MSIKEKIENNIWVVIIGASISTGLFIYSITGYFNGKEIEGLEVAHSIQIEQLKSRILSIERDIGEQRYFDLRKFIINENQINEVDSDLTYFENGDFYVNTINDYWDFKEMTEIEYIIKIAHLKDADLFFLQLLLPQFRLYSDSLISEYLEEFPIHTWWSKDSIIFYQDSIEQILYSRISIQTMPLDAFQKIMDLGVDIIMYEEEEYTNDLKIDSLELFSDIEDLKSRIANQAQIDLTGLMLTYQLYKKIQLGLTGNTIIKFDEIKKMKNISYGKIRTEYLGCAYGENENSKIYQTEEIFLISKGNALYIIQIALPSTEPRIPKELTYNVNSWLNSLKIIDP